MSISVIVPVYNVQDYIRDCVISVLKQDYMDLELLLIDDGSTDKSGAICDELQLDDKRIRVFHKPNGGLSDARNYGIDHAKGEFLTFVDSDDFIYPGYLSALMDLIKTFDADVSCIRFLISNDRIKRLDNQNVTKGFFTGEEAVFNSLLRKFIGVSACGKLFKTNLFEGIKFPKGKLFEDLLTIPYIFERCEYVAYSTEQLYFYYNRPGSITHTKVTEKHMAILDDTSELIHYLDFHCPGTHDAAVARFCIESIKRLTDILLLTDEYSKNIETIRKKSYLYWEEGLRNPYLARSIKIQIAILLRSANLYKMFFEPYKKMKYKLTNNHVTYNK